MQSHASSAGSASRPGRHLDGKVCLVTGATSGIGKEIALGLARLGATTLAVGRDPARGAAAVAELKEASGNPRVELMLADLSSHRAIRQLAAEFKERHQQLHVLVNNAGITLSERSVTEDGLERTFAVNHMAYFLLTTLLLDVLKASAPARIVNVSSDAHRAGRIKFEDLQSERKFSGMRTYCDSKLANLLFTYELARRVDGTGVTTNAAHPGMVATNFARGTKGAMALMFTLLRPFMLSAARGARPVVRLATAPELEGVTGRYFTQKGETRSSSRSYDAATARRLWQVSDVLAGLAAEGAVDIKTA